MRLITSISPRAAARRLPYATLPWAELEAEAARQGCTVADALLDRAGRPPAPLCANNATSEGRPQPVGARVLRRAFGKLRPRPRHPAT